MDESTLSLGEVSDDELVLVNERCQKLVDLVFRGHIVREDSYCGSGSPLFHDDVVVGNRYWCHKRSSFR